VALLLLACGLRARSRGERLSPRTLVLVAAVFLAHAPVSELVQHVGYPGRTGDPADVLADAAGVLVGVGLAWAVLQRGNGGQALPPVGTTGPGPSGPR